MLETPNATAAAVHAIARRSSGGIATLATGMAVEPVIQSVEKAVGLASLATAADELLDQAQRAGIDVEGVISLLRSRRADSGDGRRPTGVESKHD